MTTIEDDVKHTSIDVTLLDIAIQLTRIADCLEDWDCDGSGDGDGGRLVWLGSDSGYYLGSINGRLVGVKDEN